MTTQFPQNVYRIRLAYVGNAVFVAANAERMKRIASPDLKG